MKLFVIFLGVAGTCLIISCTRSPQQPASQSDTTTAAPITTQPIKTSFSAGRMLDTLFYTDVTGSGVPKAFVFSKPIVQVHDTINANTDSSGFPSYARYDLFQVYNWSMSDSSWKLAQQDSVHFGVGSRTMDITHDGKPDLILSTLAAGVTDASAQGMMIFSAHSGDWKQIFATTSGNPAFIDINHDSLFEIAIHRSLTGVMPNSEAVEYVSDIYAFDGTMFTKATSQYPKYFSDMAAQAQQEYTQAKTKTPVTTPITDELNFTLYKPCLQTLAWMRASGDTTAALTFWKNERDYLSRMIPQEQYVNLDVFVHIH